MRSSTLAPIRWKTAVFGALWAARHASQPLESKRGLVMPIDHTCGVAMLLDGPHRHADALCTLSKARQKFETFALVP
jgi:hypothetical protein